MHDFTPLPSFAGGLLIGLAAALLLLVHGRVAGIAGMVGGLLRPANADTPWRAAFLAGMVLGGLVLVARWPEALGTSPRPLGTIAVAGLLVGAGTCLGNGCTSGHGICGVARLSRRSFVATATFMATGGVAAVLGGLAAGG